LKYWVFGLAAALVLALLMRRVWLESPFAVPPPAATETHATAPNSPPVEAETTRAAETPATVPSTPFAPPPAIVPAATEILVRGMLRDEQGKPAENAYLRWIRSGGEASLALGTHGAYSIAGLQPGHYTVELRGEDYRREAIDVEISAQPEIQTRDFVLHPGMRFPIRIVDGQGSTPLGPGHTDATRRTWSLTVRATKNQPASTVHALNAGSNQNSECGMFLPRQFLEAGHENLGLDVLGLLTLHEAPPLFVSLAFGSAVVATQRIDEMPKELVFVIDAQELRSMLGGVRLRLMHADGRTPLQEASVTLHSQSSVGGERRVDEDGRAEFSDRTPGAYDLWLRAKGLHMQSRSIDVRPGEMLDLGEIPLREGPEQYVRFEFPGSSRPEVAFVVQPAAPGNPLGTLDRPPGSVWSCRLANRVVIPFPGPGTFELRIVMVGSPSERDTIHLGALPQRIVFGEAPGEDVVVKLEETTTVALIPPRDPPPGVRWLISTSDARPAMLVCLESRQPKLVELPRGSYSIMPVSNDPGFLDLIEPQPFTVGSSTVAVELSL